MIKYQIQEGEVELLFHVDEKGNLVINANGHEAEISHLIAVELIEILSEKMYEYQARKYSLLKRIFQ